MVPQVSEPSSAQYEDVAVAVVVVVGLADVEAADLACEASLLGALGKGAVPNVAEVAKLVVQTPRRGDDVEIAVVVEIIDDAAAGQGDHVQA